MRAKVSCLPTTRLWSSIWSSDVPLKVFVAGATGVLGRPLVAALVAAGHEVTGTSRTAARAASVDAAGGRGVVCDALDRAAVLRAVHDAAPEVVIHQLTALRGRFADLRKGSEATNRLRREGTRYLVEAAVAAGARRVIAESIAFLYAPRGPLVVGEDAPVWSSAPEPAGSMLGALRELEQIVTGTNGIEGVVLRYGALYGPGTWYAADGDMTSMVRRRRMPVVGSGGGMTSFMHVDDAAAATVCALDHGAPGVYNIVDDQPVSYRDHLPEFAKLLGAKPPRHVPRWPVRLLAGSAGATSLTEQRGAANAKAKAELGWTLRYPTWREGFAAEFA
jgi:nucleoside-diphosphate-sugar epimerase